MRKAKELFEDPDYKFMCFLSLDIIKESFIYPKGLKCLGGGASIIVFIKTKPALL